MAATVSSTAATRMSSEDATTPSLPPPLIMPSSPSSTSSSEVDLPASPPLQQSDVQIPSVVIASPDPPSPLVASAAAAEGESLDGLAGLPRKTPSPSRPLARTKRRDTMHDLVSAASGSGEGEVRAASLDDPKQRSQSTLAAPTLRTLRTSTARHVRRASTGGALPGRMHGQERDAAALKEIQAKVVIIGQAGVGKTSIVHRYTMGAFTKHEATIGAAFLTKKLVLPNAKINLQLWDTAGQERFRSTTPIFYRGSDAAVVVYDITREQSFLDVKSWLDELRVNLNQDFVLHVVGAKLDLARERQVDLDRAKRQVHQWLCEPPGPVFNVILSPQNTVTSHAELNATETSDFAPKRTGLTLSTFGFGGRGRREEAKAVAPPSAEPSMAFKVSEVSALTNSGIDDLFLQVSLGLARRRVAIEQEQDRRTRESIRLSEASLQSPTTMAPAGTWGCC